MFDYYFMYNLPSDNHVTRNPDVMITVRATVNPFVDEEKVSIRFPMMPAYQVMAVKDWPLAYTQIVALAKTEFKMKWAVKQTELIIEEA